MGKKLDYVCGPNVDGIGSRIRRGSKMIDNKVQMQAGCTACFDRSTTVRDVANYVAAQMNKQAYIHFSASGTKAAKIIHLASPMRIRHQKVRWTRKRRLNNLSKTIDEEWRRWIITG